MISRNHTRRSLHSSISKQSTKYRRRRLIVEMLEDRRMLNVDWRNPVDSLDVDSDGFIAPLDVLVVINYINSAEPKSLPPQRDPAKPFFDTDGDQAVTPLDVLRVINELNSEGGGKRNLTEGTDRLARETDLTITLGQLDGTRHYRVRLDSQFDTSDRTSGLEDLLAVYLVDPTAPNKTLLSKGENGTALFTLAGTKADYALGRVRWDGSILDIDLSDLQFLDTGLLKFQLLSSDSDFATRISFKPLTNEVDLEATSGPFFQSNSTLVTKGAALNLSGLSTVSDVIVEIGDVRFNSGTGKYAASIRLRNNGDAVGRDVAVVFPGLPATVSLRNASGATTAGEPYVNMKPAITRGGLARGMWSDPVEVEFNNPGQVQFVLKPRVLANTNHPPTLDAIQPLSVTPGGVLDVRLAGSDSDGDLLSYSLRNATSLPATTISDNGRLVFRPTVNQIGRYSFDVVVSDGVLEAMRSVILDVVADPVTSTRISGKILKVDGQPIFNMHVEMGSVQALTRSDGSFTLDLGSGIVASDTIKIRGERFAGPLTYPFLAEKAALLLEHAVIQNVNNIIGRPIYLPNVDTANAITVDPTIDTKITTSAIPGAEVLVKAGTLINLQGTPYTGKLSITEVPVSFTPAGLPSNLIPDLVATIQPSEMVFSTPAPIKLPNRAGRVPGRPMDLWAVNPTNGQFEIVGKMVVSADGKTIDTVSGGVRYSSWEFTADPINQPDPGPYPYQSKNGCEQEKHACPINSQVETYSGAVIESHDLVSYQSQGQSKGLTLVYDSLRADPQPIVHFRYRNAAPDPNHRLSAGVAIDRGTYYKAFSNLYDTLGGTFAENFWSIPESGGTIDAALQLDMRNEPSGAFQYTLTSGILQLLSPSGWPFSGNGGEDLVGTLAKQLGTIIHVNTIQSPFGAGWGLAGLQHLIENPNGSVLLVDGDGSELIFEPGYVSPGGDFSVLSKGPDGSFTRTMKDQTVYSFTTQGRLKSIVDRNGNQTVYSYDAAGLLTKITDPVGLQTVFTYLDSRVASIVDPANRITQFNYDAAGNLTKVTDPDGTSRTWQYDNNHHQTVEIDKRGLKEQTFYDFAGRASRSIRKDGSEIKIAPVEVRGLYRNTSDRNNPPVAVSLGEAQSQYVTANGNVITSTLDRLGQVVSQRDSVGKLPASTRDSNNLVNSTKDARGNSTFYTYDARGNLLKKVDSLSGDGVIRGDISQAGERHSYTFEGTAGERILIDGRDTSTQVNLTAQMQLIGPDGLTLARTSTGSDTNPIILPLLGTYRIEIDFPLGGDAGVSRLAGLYQFKLHKLSDAPVLALNKSQQVKVPAFHTTTWQFDGIAGTRVTYPYRSSLQLQLKLISPDNSFLYSNSLTSTLPLTGKYLLVAYNESDSDAVTTIFVNTETPASSATSGFDQVHSGTLQPNEMIEFRFSGPAGLPFSYENPGVQSLFPKFQHLATGEELQIGYRPAVLPRSGEYSVTYDNRFSSAPTTFSFRMLNMQAPNRKLVTGTPVNLSLQPNAETYYAFEGTIGDRVILSDSGLETSILHLESGSINYDNIVGSKLPQTGTYYVKLQNRTATPVSTTVAKFDIPTEAMNLDVEISGRLVADGAPHIFSFQTTAGDLLFFDDLGSTPGGGWALLGPDSKYIFGNSLGQENVGTIRTTGTHYLLLTSRERSGVLPIAHDYRFRILNFVPTVRPLTLGQLVTGTIDRPNDTDEYTFQGTAGQRLFFDGLTRSSSLKVSLISPSGVDPYRKGNIFGPGPSNDIATLTLIETGTYRFNVYGDYVGNFFTGDYQFRLSDSASLTKLNIGGSNTGDINPQLVASPFVFTGRQGQQLKFQLTGQPGTLSGVNLSLFGPASHVANFGGESPFSILLPSDGTYILTNAADRFADQSSIPFELVTTDTSVSVVPSGLSTLLSGRIGAGEIKTYSFSAPAMLNLLFDNHSLEDIGIQAVITDDTDAIKTELVSYSVGANNTTLFTVPKSSSYTITVRGRNASTTGDYEFRFVDILHDSIPIQFDTLIQGTFASNKKGVEVYRFVTAPGQAFMVDKTAYDWSYSIKSPDEARYADLPTIAFPGNNYLFATTNDTRGLDFSFRVINLETVPELVLGEAVEGTAEPGRAVIYKTDAIKGDRLVYEVFNSAIFGVWDRSMGSFVSRSVQATELVVPHDGTYWFIRDNDFIRTPFPFKLRLTKPENKIAIPLNTSGGTAGELRLTYDPNFNQLTSVVDELGRQTSLDIDVSNGNTLKAIQKVGELGGSDDFVSSFTYSPSGQVDTTTDPLGRVTDNDYDPLGRLISITFAKGTPNQTKRSFEYDAVGNVTAIIDENNHRTEFQYDALSRLLRQIDPDPDGAGPLVSPVTQWTYDSVGNLLTATDAMGHISKRTYDEMERLITESDPGNNVSRYTYDRAGNLVSVTDPLNNASQFIYDARNRLVSSIDPANNRTTFTYDADNNTTSLTDASGNKTQYKYDARNRVTNRIDPLGKSELFAYSFADDLTETTDRIGRITEFKYDDLGRTTTEVWRNADRSIANTVTYTYDAASNLVRLKDGSSDLQFTLDSLNRTTREQASGPNGIPTTILDLIYDAIGNRLSVTDTINGQAGAKNAYTYDALDRTTRVVQTAVGAASVATKRVDFAYNAGSQFTSLIRATDTAGQAVVAASTFTYDTLNRLDAITHKNSTGTTLASFTYQYDAASRITRITDIDGATDYNYDTRDQLTAALHADPANVDETYGYDSTGNRTTSQRHGTGYVVGDGAAGTPDNNRLTSDGTYRYSYDAEGNLMLRSHIANGSIREFAWDHRNRLVRISDRAAANGTAIQTVSYLYDALDRRTAESVTSSSGATSSTYFVYDGNNVLADWTDADGPGPQTASESMRYLHGPAVDQVLSQEDSSGFVLWDLADHLGTVRDLVDNSGAVVNHLKYDSFGSIFAMSSSAPTHFTRYQFTGREFDIATGLNYYRARYYNAATGRFVSEDPIGFNSGDVNAFRYVANNPLTYVDPSGLLGIVGALSGPGSAAAIGGLGGKQEAQYGVGVFLGLHTGLNAGDFTQDTNAIAPSLNSDMPSNYRINEKGQKESLPDNNQKFSGLARAVNLIGASVFVTDADNICDVGKMSTTVTLSLEFIIGGSIQYSYGGGIQAIGFSAGVGLGGELFTVSTNAETTTRNLGRLGGEKDCGCP